MLGSQIGFAIVPALAEVVFDYSNKSIFFNNPAKSIVDDLLERDHQTVQTKSSKIGVASRIFRTFECGGDMVQAATSFFSVL